MRKTHSFQSDEETERILTSLSDDIDKSKWLRNLIKKHGIKNPLK